MTAPSTGGPTVGGPTVDRFLPGLAVLRSYQRSWLRLDLIGGLTVGAMLVPQSMAYAELAGMPPQYGFFAVLVPLVVYALMGTSRHLGVGPEPGTAILAATGVGAIAAGDPDRYLALMAALALLVGAVCVAGAVLRLGFIASLLSKPVLVGYITGVGLTLLSSQFATFTGVGIEADRFFPRVAELVTSLDEVHGATLALGTATLAVLLGMRVVAPRAPGALVGVAGATALMVLFGLGDHGVAAVGEIPGGLPTPGLPTVTWDDIGRLLPVAAGIALVGFTDNLLTARSIAARKGYRVDANQELFALGATNLAAGISRGFPVSSSASRTAVPAALGSRTQLVSLVAAASVLVTITGLRGVLAEIPRAALAAVIVTAAIAIIDVNGYRSLWKVDRNEAVLAVAAALGVVGFDVLIGVLVAVALSVVVALRRIARPHDAVLGDVPGLDGWVDVDSDPDARTEPGLLVYRFDAPLFFVNAERFTERVERVLAENAGREEWLILDFEGVGDLDTTALDALADLVERLDTVDVIAVARANRWVLGLLERAGVLAPAGRVTTYATINSAVRAYRDRHG